MTTTFLLIRHAAHDDLDLRLSGRTPGVALSAAGRAQAVALGDRIASLGPSRVSCSPLERTVATAHRIAAASGLPAPTLVEALTEIDLGGWTGRAFDSFGDDPAWRAWNEQRHRASPPGGESMVEAQARIAGWLRAAAAAHPGETVAVVTHSDMIRAAVADVLGLALDKLLRFDIDPASITTVVMGDWGAKLVRLNEKGGMMADEEALRDRVAALAPWFHNIDLGHGIQTAPEHFLGDYPRFKFATFADALPADLSGKSVLDIGCNAGFYSVEMKRRGATRVLGIDADARYLEQARLATRALGFDSVEFRQLDVYDVGALGERFDLVVFMGVLYHLRHPLLALDLIREHVAADLLLFQTLQQGSGATMEVPEDHPFYEPGGFTPPAYFDDPRYPKLHFIEHRFAGDWTNWWAPNRACSEAMLRAAGFTVEARPADDVYICRTAPTPYGEWGPTAVYPARGA